MTPQTPPVDEERGAVTPSEEIPPHIKTLHDADRASVLALCERAGYGFTIAEASRLWAAKVWGNEDMARWLESHAQTLRDKSPTPTGQADSSDQAAPAVREFRCVNGCGTATREEAEQHQYWTGHSYVRAAAPGGAPDVTLPTDEMPSLDIRLVKSAGRGAKDGAFPLLKGEAPNALLVVPHDETELEAVRRIITRRLSAGQPQDATQSCMLCGFVKPRAVWHDSGAYVCQECAALREQATRDNIVRKAKESHG